MAILRDTLILGDARVTDTLYANTVNGATIIASNLTLPSGSNLAASGAVNWAASNVEYGKILTSTTGALAIYNKRGLFIYSAGSATATTAASDYLDTNGIRFADLVAIPVGTYALGNSSNKWSNIYATAINDLTLTAVATGFTIAGGTTSKTLTVSESITLLAGAIKKIAYYSAANTISGYTDLYINDTDGATGTSGKTELVVGNSTATGTASRYGMVSVFSQGTKGTDIVAAANSTAWYLATLLAKTGTIAYLDDIPSVVDKVTINTASLTTTSTAYYPLIHTSTSGTTTVSAHSTYKIYMVGGTTSTVGYALLSLGNSAVSGSANNSYGALRLYDKSGGNYAQLVTVDSFPPSGTVKFAKTGTVAMTSDLVEIIRL